MDENLASLLKALNDGWQQAVALLSNPWNLLGIGLVIAVYVVVRFGTRGLTARLGKRLAETSPVPQLVPLTQVLPKLVVAAATALILWLLIGAMREIGPPSRTYVMGVVASLLTAWVVIRLASSFIRNQLVARMVAIVVWALAALNIVGYLQDSLTFFDRLAVDIGGLHLSLLTVAKAVIAVTLLLWGATALSAGFDRRMQRASDLTPSMRALISKLARILLFILALVLAMRAVGVDLTSVAVFSGAIGLGIGFGLQKIVSNLISGVILLVDRSIKPGDVIELGNTFGWVNALGARYTSVATRDGKEFLIPNEDLITHQVVNWSYSHDLVRLEVEFAVTFECDVHVVRKVAIEAVTGLGRVMEQPAPLCHLKEFRDNGICFLLRFWIRDPQNGVVNVKSEVQVAIWEAFRHAGLRFAYPYHEVYVRDRRDGRGAWPLPLAGD